MKEFNYVDTDSKIITETKEGNEMNNSADEIRGLEHGLKIRAIRNLIAGAHNVDVTIDGKTIRATHEVSELRRPIGDPINGNYVAVYATTEEDIFLFVRVNEWCNIYSMEFGRVEGH